MPSSLNSAKEKLGRATRHLEVATEVFNSFVGNNLYTTSGKQDKKKRLVLFVTSVREFPPDFALAVGDCAHNLRSCLDHIVFPFANCTEKEEGAIQFPLVSKRAYFKGEAKTRLIGVNGKVISEIKRLQPYHKRTRRKTWLLWVIRGIDNWDKHRRLIVAINAVISATAKITFTSGETLVHSAEVRTGILKPGAILARLEVTGMVKGAKLQIEHQPTFVPLLDKRMSKELRRVPVLHALEACRDFIRDEVIPGFEKFL